jgi:hypothetical protein
MGMGIEAREARFHDAWQPHISACKKFIRESLPRAPQPVSIAIFGAGRLFDIDKDFLAQNYSDIALFDADPSCIRHWKAFKRNKCRSNLVLFNIVDVTCYYDEFCERLKRGTFNNLNELIEFVVSDGGSALTTQKFGEFDDVVSLNLLGQIPLYFRDRIFHYAEKRGFVKSPENEQALLKACHTLGSRLQLQHITFLASVTCSRLAIITDVEFSTYVNDPRELEPSPAISKEVLEALKILPGLTFTAKNSWQWHLAPRGFENREYGEIHQIAAYCYEKKPLS